MKVPTAQLRPKFLCSLLAAVLWFGGAPATLQAGEGDELFEQRVAGILVRNCLGCHNPSEPNGDLDLSTRASAFEGGYSGPAVVPGDLEESWLLERVTEGSMPPEEKAEPLAEEEIAALREWIAAGAPWPEERRLSAFDFSTERRAGYDWWSLQPLEKPPVPASDGDGWARTPVDRFIVEKLSEHGLKPSAEADRATLLRRAKFDLLGLPPTPEEIRAFVEDDSPDAYERLIDRYLASPHYGERWGRHWLDVVRFGETNGYETNTPRPNAWPYRDYVIESLNADKPYRDFIREQLAGDQLGADVATAFLVGGPKDTVGNQTLEGMLQQRADDLNDMIAATSEAFLGLTVTCARCHDHKFDPIAQRDYYALKAVFAGVKHGERTIRGPEYEERLREEPEVRAQLADVQRQLDALEPLAQLELGSDDAPRRPPVHARWNSERFEPVAARFVRFTVFETNQYEPCIDELEVFTAEESPRNVALASAGATASASSLYRDGNSSIHRLEHINDGKYGNSRSWISGEDGGGWVQIELAEETLIDRIVWARDREGRFGDRLATRYHIEVAVEPDAWQVVASNRDRNPYDPSAEPQKNVSPEDLPAEQREAARELTAKLAALEARLPESAMQTVYAGTFEEQPEPTYLLYRGDPMEQREPVGPGAIAALGRPLELADDAPDHERRLALANWIADELNPLTARVLVNRMWHYHFGQGLVSTPSDFGFHGGRPTHPELLDWLAAQFIESGWRMKPLHRLIMLSSVYRQSGAYDEKAAAVDADSRLLWRYPPRRLEAEPIRDAILFVSGKLDLRMGGPGYDPFEPNTNYVHVYIPKTSFGPEEWRRMVYQFKPRMEQDATFGAFDCPDASSGVARRNVSTTALQALNLLNSPFVVEQAEFFAQRLLDEAGDDVEQQVRRAFWLAFGRDADEEELIAACQLVEQHGLTSLCRAIYNANEFIYYQ